MNWVNCVIMQHGAMLFPIQTAYDRDHRHVAIVRQLTCDTTYSANQLSVQNTARNVQQRHTIFGHLKYDLFRPVSP